VEHPGVPMHNNYAEYLIRIGVLKRKISGGSVSVEGANAYAVFIRRIFKVIEKYRESYLGELFVLHRIGSRDLVKTHNPGASDGASQR